MARDQRPFWSALEALRGARVNAPARLSFEAACLLEAGVAPLPSPWREAPAPHPELRAQVCAWACARPVERIVPDLHDHLMALAEQRPSGAIYTPHGVARAVVAQTLGVWGRAGLPRMLEPGCGAGALLMAWVEAVWERAADPQTLLGSLWAEECDADAAEVARRALALALALRWRGAAPWPLDPDPIQVADVLRDDAPHTPRFDVVLSNPPYCAKDALTAEQRADWAARFDLGDASHVDTAWLFLEATWPRLRPGGHHTALVPDAVLARDGLAPVRRWLTREGRVHRIARFGRAFTTPRPQRDARKVAVGLVALTVERAASPSDAPLDDAATHSRWARDADAATWHRRAQAPIWPDALPSGGSPWRLDAPAWWWTPDEGPEARLSAAARCVAALLRPGARGASRGEPLGKRDLHPLEPGSVAVLSGARVHRLGVSTPNVGLHRARLKRSPELYAGPLVLVVKTGAAPVAAACPDGAAFLQSVYGLHLSDDARAEGWDVWALAGVLCSAWLAAWSYCRWTAAKDLQPQLTLGNVRALPLPNLSSDALAALGALAREAHHAPQHSATRAELERRIDALVGDGFGLPMTRWGARLNALLCRLPRSQRPSWCNDPV